MASGTTSSTPSLTSSLSVLERAWEWKWMLRMTMLILFLDIALCTTGRPGVLDWDTTAPTLLSNLGFVLVTITAFSVYAAVVIPAASSLLRDILVNTKGVSTAINFLFSDRKPQDTYGTVSLSELECHAFSTDSSYWLDKYYEVRRSYINGILESRHVGNLAFGSLILSILDWTLHSAESPTFLGQLAAMTDTETFTVVSAIVFIATLGVTGKAWFSGGALPRIYQPALHHSLRSKNYTPPAWKTLSG